MDRDFNFSEGPLWFAPETLQARMLQGLDVDQDRSFQLSCLYGGLNVFFLCLFAFYTWSIGEAGFAVPLIVLAALMAAGHGLVWLLGLQTMARHFVSFMMAAMCVLLFCIGGLQNTGPLYYFVFPIAALSLNGRLYGAIWVIGLMLVTVLLWNGWFGLDLPDYDSVFVTRVVGLCLIITVLASIPEYYRSRAERSLLLNWSDMEQFSFGDPRSGLANRSLLRKLLHMEYQRHQRYGSPCSVMFLQTDPVTSLLHGTHVHVDSARLSAAVGEVLRQNLRVQDTAGRWDDNTYLLLLPEISAEGAVLLAQRLLDAVRAAGASLSSQPLRLHASIGIAAFDSRLLPDVLHAAADHLADAQRAGGDRYSI